MRVPFPEGKSKFWKSTNQGGGPHPPSPNRAHQAQPGPASNPEHWRLRVTATTQHPAYRETRRPRSCLAPLAPHRKGRDVAEVGTEPERQCCEPIGGAQRRPGVSGRVREAPTDSQGRAGGVWVPRPWRSAGESLLVRTVAAGVRPSEAVFLVPGCPGPHRDERAEDAGPLEAQVTESRYSGAASGFFPDRC